MIEIKIVTCAEMREAEAYAVRQGIHSVRLMENAGSASARFIRDNEQLSGVRCTVVCGMGNNGGDGLVAARRLADTGAEIAIILSGGMPRTPEASEMFERLNGLNFSVFDYSRDSRRCLSLLEHSAVIIDAVFGTGFYGSVSESVAELFNAVNASRATVYSLDMPSGADADKGTVAQSCVKADYTIAYAAAKAGQFTYPAEEYCGKLHVVNIGIPNEAFSGVRSAELLDKEKIQSCLPVRAKSSNKGTYGKLLCLCGSLTMPGAAYMAASGGARCGAGLVTICVPKSIYQPLAGKLSEALISPLDETPEGSFSYRDLDLIARMAENASAVVLGCGLSRSSETEKLVCGLLQSIACPVILDADGINAVSGHMHVLRESKAKLVLTPHPGEMSRLTGRSVAEIQNDRIGVARGFADTYGVTLVLKGADTVIASPDGKLYVNPTGNPGMARGGSGDILAGMIAGFAAQGIKPADAACCGVYIHGLAGDRCAGRLSQYGMLPTDLLLDIPQILRELSR